MTVTIIPNTPRLRNMFTPSALDRAVAEAHNATQETQRRARAYPVILAAYKELGATVDASLADPSNENMDALRRARGVE